MLLKTKILLTLSNKNIRVLPLLKILVIIALRQKASWQSIITKTILISVSKAKVRNKSLIESSGKSNNLPRHHYNRKATC